VSPRRSAQRGLGALSQLIVGPVGSRLDRRVDLSDPLDACDPRDAVEARAGCRVHERRRVTFSSYSYSFASSRAVASANGVDQAAVLLRGI